MKNSGSVSLWMSNATKSNLNRRNEFTGIRNSSDKVREYVVHIGSRARNYSLRKYSRISDSKIEPLYI